MKPEHSDLFPITVDFGATTENFYVGMASDTACDQRHKERDSTRRIPVL